MGSVADRAKTLGKHEVQIDVKTLVDACLAVTVITAAFEAFAAHAVDAALNAMAD